MAGLRGFVVLLLVLPLGAPVAAGHSDDDKGKGPPDDVDVCEYAAHGSTAEKARGAGNGTGAGKVDTCSKTFARWTATSLDVYVNAANGPSAIAGTTFTDFVQKALTEWGCHSGIGESLTLNFVSSPSGAEITVGWGNLGTTGILGQAATSAFKGVISHSDVTMNSNQAAFSWTAGPAPSVDANGCAVEVGNGNTASSSYDLLSVLTHEIGHSLGVSHPSSRCSAGDHCYPVTMYSCTDAEEFMRRALNAGDVLSIKSLYGAQQ